MTETANYDRILNKEIQKLNDLIPPINEAIATSKARVSILRKKFRKLERERSATKLMGKYKIEQLDAQDVALYKDLIDIFLENSEVLLQELEKSSKEATAVKEKFMREREETITYWKDMSRGIPTEKPSRESDSSRKADDSLIIPNLSKKYQKYPLKLELHWSEERNPLIFGLGNLMSDCLRYGSNMMSSEEELAKGSSPFTRIFQKITSGLWSGQSSHPILPESLVRAQIPAINFRKLHFQEKYLRMIDLVENSDRAIGFGK